jgi:putative hydrolase of the HAD superfamily
VRRRHPAHALLIDFDGVLRHYDPAISAALEKRHGVTPGATLAAGLEWQRFIPAVTGTWTRRQWLDSISEATGMSAEALTEWDSYRGFIDPVVLDFVRGVRAAGRPVALATNATDDLRADLDLFGIAGDFDAIVSSAEVGWHKPSPPFFTAACAAVGELARHCLLVDDTDRDVQGARAAGLSAIRWTGPDDLRYIAKALGVFLD